MTSRDKRGGASQESGVKKGGRPKGSFSDPLRREKIAIAIALGTLGEINGERRLPRLVLPEKHLMRWATLLADPETRIDQTVEKAQTGDRLRIELIPRPNMNGDFLKNKIRATAQHYSGSGHGQHGYQGSDAFFVEESAFLISALVMFHDLALPILGEALQHLGWDTRTISNLQAFARSSNIGNPKFHDAEAAAPALGALMEMMLRR